MTFLLFLIYITNKDTIFNLTTFFPLRITCIFNLYSEDNSESCQCHRISEVLEIYIREGHLVLGKTVFQKIDLHISMYFSFLLKKLLLRKIFGWL